MAFQRLVEIGWTPCDTDERGLYYMFYSRSVHDVPTAVLEMRRQDANGNVVTG